MRAGMILAGCIWIEIETQWRPQTDVIYVLIAINNIQ